MSITINIVIPSVTQLLIYLGIGLIVAIVVGLIGRAMALLSIFTLTILAAIGAWLTVSFIRFQIQSEVAFGGVRLIEATIGALVFGLGWALFLTRRKMLIK